MPQQLSLALSLQDNATFSTFYSSARHALALKSLETLVARNGERPILLWGASGAGISHLLQACCHQGVQAGQQVQYLPLKLLQDYAPTDVLEGLDCLDLVCLDDLQVIRGRENWEQALFHCFNRVRDAGGQWVLGLQDSPLQANFTLPDLQSRVRGCETYQIALLDDSEKAAALQHRASLLGMQLSGEVTRYLLNRVSRRTQDLFALLAQLDAVSLQRQRKLTIPFVKEALADS